MWNDFTSFFFQRLIQLYFSLEYLAGGYSFVLEKGNLFSQNSVEKLFNCKDFANKTKPSYLNSGLEKINWSIR